MIRIVCLMALVFSLFVPVGNAASWVMFHVPEIEGRTDLPLEYFDADSVQTYRDKDGHIQSIYYWEKMIYTSGMAGKSGDALAGKIDYQIGLIRLDVKTKDMYAALVSTHFVNGKNLRNSPLVWSYRAHGDWSYVYAARQILDSEKSRAEKGIRLKTVRSPIDLNTLVLPEYVEE